ncbi:MAG: SAM-dependent methyltransferase [Desulfuromonas sp.]|nr:MAG: SAM-dependent methyltransferase [Desulfuromonas sp.]
MSVPGSGLPDVLLQALGGTSPSDREVRRLFHGRGGCTPSWRHLVVDWYPPLLHIISYADPGEPVIRELLSQIPGHVEAVLLQRRDLADTPMTLLRGELPQEIFAVEDGLRYALFFDRDRNVGFFPDMRVGRRLVRERAAERRILNLFAYTCGFSVAAIAGGASQVVNLDMNRNLLQVGRDNHRLNGHDLRRCSFLSHDLFKSFGKLRRIGPFDLVIIDPPGEQGESFQPHRHWPKLLQRLPELLAPEGEILAAVSSPHLGRRFLANQFETSLPTADLVESYTAGDDFPENDPDKGLHLLWFRNRNRNRNP